MITWNADVVAKHETSGGSHDTWNDDDGSDFGLEIGATGGVGETSDGHGAIKCGNRGDKRESEWML